MSEREGVNGFHSLGSKINGLVVEGCNLNSARFQGYIVYLFYFLHADYMHLIT